MSWASARAWRSALSGRLAFTNGVFDLLHRGHVDVLHGARAKGDALLVAINSDESVRRLKGPSRPVCTEADRAYVVAALEAVDAVVLFSQDTPLELINLIRPDVLVKGGDYRPEMIVGRAEVESWGGEVAVVTLTPGASTTSIIERLRADTGA